MEFPIFLYLAFLLLVALFSTRLMHFAHLPNVTGFIITGILVGPFVFGLFFNNFTYVGIKDAPIYQYVSRLGWVSTLALGFIAFSIGTSFHRKSIAAVGKKIVVITILESLGASVLVLGAMLAAHFLFPDAVSWELAFTLAAIAAATAPAATLMVIKQYKAKGELVDTLLPVVALDDASALILFAILFQVAKSVSLGEGFDAYKMFAKPLLEIVISLGIGAIMGVAISFFSRLFHSRNNRLMLCIFAIFANIGLYYLFKNEALGGFELSSLLMCMASGMMFANLGKDPSPTLDLMDRFTSPIYLFFFVLSGASLDLTIFFSEKGVVVILIALVYIAMRVIGKWSGAYLGARVSHCSEKVRRYLGFALVPQAGVAIGLATTAYSSFSSSPVSAPAGALILAVVLTSTLVYELFGPTASKFALTKAGDIPIERKPAEQPK